MAAATEVLKAKVCVVGEAAVGKTSLVHRFAYDRLQASYVPTLAAQITKHELPVELDGTPIRVVLTIWDVMGEPTFLPLLEDAWLSRAQGVLAVADLTRPETFPALRRWTDAVARVSGAVPVMLLANKVDAVPSGAIDVEEEQVRLGLRGWGTSAKTGHNVGVAFQTLVEQIARRNFASLKESRRMRAEPA